MKNRFNLGMAEDYEHQLSGRRPVMWLVLMGVLGFIGVAWGEPAPIFFWVILAATLGLVLWSLIANPISGLRISGDRLIIAPQQQNNEISLANVDYLKIDNRSDSTEFVLYLKDGGGLAVHENNFPSIKETTRVFEERGIKVARL
ncbi:hypothetical protein L0666_09765 [Octadecabacter sp. CECT 8868]|uniref:hypothetical protein n=1 Tax=Octadecabacter algicola TaxID=2909342 RepID=UPI001F1999FE|nr:hypothetical protein [Octadecabacter algicola]MCF2905276.1 hypothetical protein [Octadecabacter algicola]